MIACVLNRTQRSLIQPSNLKLSLKDRIYIWTVNEYGEVEFHLLKDVFEGGMPSSHHEEFGIPYDDRLYYLYQGDMLDGEGTFTPIELIA